MGDQFSDILASWLPGPTAQKRHHDREASIAGQRRRTYARLARDEEVVRNIRLGRQ